MKKTEQVKDTIVSATKELIVKSTGSIDQITTRAIAEKANVGVGLINYHFQTKDNLIEICVQQIISNVIASFKPSDQGDLIGINRLIASASRVFDFLYENPAVSRISILGDFQSPKLSDNTIKTMKAFERLLYDCEMTDNKKRALTFAITSTMQAAFLRQNDSKELFGSDFKNKDERSEFISHLITTLYGDIK